MAAFYSEKVMDHFANPRNVGELEDANGVGEIGNAKCGDIMKMYIKVEDGRGNFTRRILSSLSTKRRSWTSAKRRFCR